MAASSSETSDPKDFESLGVDDALSKLGSDASQGLSAVEAEKRLAESGPNALPEEKRSLLSQIAAYFWGPIPWMIEAAAILSAVAGDIEDLIIILVMLLLNAAIGFWQEHQASNALSALKNQLALTARVRRDGDWQDLPASDLVPGDIVHLRLGDVIPADVKLIAGSYLSVDQAALTGESLPVNKAIGDMAFSGSLAKQGEMDALVTATGVQTFFGKTAQLVAGAGAKSHFQQAVMRVGDFLIVAALALAVVLIAHELMAGTPFLELLQFVLILVVASIPVAMPAVLSVTMALGALALSKQKAIVARLQSIEEMAGVDVLCSDKTGTLTQNRLTLGDPLPLGGTATDDLLLSAALACSQDNDDPIDQAILAGVPDKSRFEGYRQTGFTPFDPVSKRASAKVEHAGTTLSVAKGAPQAIVDLASPPEAEASAAMAEVERLAAKGYRALAVAEDRGEGWRLLGILALYDPPREDSAPTIAQAREHGIAVKMVTGDDVAIGREIAGELGIGKAILPASQLFDGAETRDNSAMAHQIERADGFARVFPEHKYRIVKSLQDEGHIVAMTGDGVNDAPALKQADVGIAVSGATDAARAAAALILTEPGLSTIVRAVDEARRIFERMLSYTIYRIAMTIDIMVFVVLATVLLDFRPLTAVMIILLALLDDIPIMAIAYDRAKVSAKPVVWNMRRTILIATWLGLLSVVESFGLLYMGRELWALGIDELQSIMFLQLVAGGHLLLLLTRTQGFFFLPPYPAPILLGAIFATQAVAVLMCGLGWPVPQLDWQTIGLVWGYNLAWMVVLDVLKVAAYRTLDRPRRHEFFSSLAVPPRPSGRP
ncbi:MAG: plasma-membrane proton-efflux P-type ATPase [Kiloniellales bacterium]